MWARRRRRGCRPPPAAPPSPRRGAAARTSAATSSPFTCTGLLSTLIVTSSPGMTRNFSAAPWMAFSAVDAGQVVVIGEDEELVAVLAIPADHVVRRAVAVAVEGVGVGVPLEPAAGDDAGRRLRRPRPHGRGRGAARRAWRRPAVRGRCLVVSRLRLRTVALRLRNDPAPARPMNRPPSTITRPREMTVSVAPVTSRPS